MNGKKLVLENIKKHYGPFTLSVSLEMKKGEFHTFLGPSGCGKTTLLRIIAGFVSPDSGALFLEGKNITYTPAELRNISIVFQDYALFPNLSVYGNISYGPETKKWDKKLIREISEELLSAVKMEGYGKRRPETLSGGEKQRVALARAIAVNPSLLLLDEPLSAADEKLKSTLKKEILSVHREKDLTTIYVTHDQEEAMTMSDRISIFGSGNIVQTGTPEEIYFSPVSLYAANFIGSSNMIKCRIISSDFYITADTGNSLILIKKRDFPSKPGERCVIFFRPEQCKILRGENIFEAKSNIFRGEIIEKEFYGKFFKCSVKTGNNFITLYDNYPFSLDYGPCCFTVSPEDILLFPESDKEPSPCKKR